MPAFDLVVRNGTVITEGSRGPADIGVRDGRVVALGLDLDPGAEEVDATGLWVLPGGIDSHVHLDQPTPPGITFADGFESGTRAAAAGGNTTVMPFVMQEKGTSLRAAVLACQEKARGACHVDVSFHMVISDPTPAVLGQELPALVKDGLTSFKVFMTYDDLVLNDRELLEVFGVARREGALVMVHAEGYDTINYMIDTLEAEGNTAPHFHDTSRPELVEREATHRAISHAELLDVPIMIVHVSGREAMEQIKWAQARGLKVYGETCPQYLVLTEDDMQGLNMEGAKFVCSPPPRDVESQRAVWSGIETGVFSTFSSDHCPFYYEGSEGKQNPKARTSFRWVPNGIPGVETRLPILFSEGVSTGRITPERFVALSATNHARMYGMYPRKGTIAVGSDADFALWDPGARRTIRQADLHHGSDYTPYEGLEITGWPVTTIVRGRVVYAEGRVAGGPGWGQEIARDLSPYAAHAGGRGQRAPIS